MNDTIKRQLSDELHYASCGTFSAGYLISNREYSLAKFFKDKPDFEEYHNDRLLELAENYTEYNQRLSRLSRYAKANNIALA